MKVVKKEAVKGVVIEAFWYKQKRASERDPWPPLAYGYRFDADGIEVEGRGCKNTNDALYCGRLALKNMLDQAPPPRGRYKAGKLWPVNAQTVKP